MLRIEPLDHPRARFLAILNSGERKQAAGFKDPTSGKFEELMLLRDDQDLQEFLHQYHVGESEIGREW